MSPGQERARKPMAFISYRQRDALPHARALHEKIESEYGPGSAFLDFQSLAAGNQWDAGIEQACENATVMLAVIGPGWVEALSLVNRTPSEDWFRKELTGAIRRGMPIMPVAVAGAALPTKAELPPELQSLDTRQGIVLREKAWDRDVEYLLGELTKHHGFKPRVRPPWAILFLLIAIVVFGGALAAARFLGVGTLLTVPLALFICVTAIILWSLLSPLLGAPAGPGLPQGSRWVGPVVLGIVVLVIGASLIGLWTSMFLGAPVDMRDRLNPKIVTRRTRPTFPDVFQNPVPIAHAFTSPVLSGTNDPAADAPFWMAKFTTNWLVEGSSVGGKRAYVYRFVPEKPDYYQPFDATVAFHPATASIAQLTEGAAFLVRQGEDHLDWRQVSLWISDKNSDNIAPQPTLMNRLLRVQMDAGDTLMLILSFQPAPEKSREFAGTSVADFAAKLDISS